MAGEETLGRWVEGASLNTDNHPYLEFTPALAYFTGVLFQVRNMRDILELKESVTPYLADTGGAGDPAAGDEDDPERAGLVDRVRRRELATEHSLRGDIRLLMGQRDEAFMEYRRALMLDPSDKGIRNPIWRGERRER